MLHSGSGARCSYSSGSFYRQHQGNRTRPCCHHSSREKYTSICLIFYSCKLRSLVLLCSIGKYLKWPHFRREAVSVISRRFSFQGYLYQNTLCAIWCMCINTLHKNMHLLLAFIVSVFSDRAFGFPKSCRHVRPGGARGDRL